MKRYFPLLIIPALLLCLPLSAAGADKVRLKHLTSAYADAAGIGLKTPEGVACDERYLYVADTGNRRLLRYVFKDGVLIADKVMPVENAAPLLVQVNAKGELYFLDGKDRKIVKVDAAGNLAGPLAPKGVPGSAKMVPKSFRIAGDSFYILDIHAERVLVLDGAGAYLRQIPFPEGYGFFSDLALDERGSVYLLDSVKGVVYHAAKDAEGFVVLADGLKEFMNFPTALTPDNRGRIFLVDQYGSGLALIRTDGSFTGRRLGLGWDEGFLYYPGQICINSKGEVFIADRNNSRVQAFSVLE